MSRPELPRITIFFPRRRAVTPTRRQAAAPSHTAAPCRRAHPKEYFPLPPLSTPASPSTFPHFPALPRIAAADKQGLVAEVYYTSATAGAATVSRPTDGRLADVCVYQLRFGLFATYTEVKTWC